MPLEVAFDGYAGYGDDLRDARYWPGAMEESLEAILARRHGIASSVSLEVEGTAEGNAGRMVSGRCVIAADGDVRWPDIAATVIEFGYLAGGVRFAGSRDGDGTPDGGGTVRPESYGSRAKMSVPLDAFSSLRDPLAHTGPRVERWLTGQFGLASDGLAHATAFVGLPAELHAGVAATMGCGTLYVDMFFADALPGEARVTQAVLSAIVFSGGRTRADEYYGFMGLPGQP